MLTQQQARDWLARWDHQQEYYVPDREERFAVIADVVETVTARPDPLIVDLGVGPGSLAVRLLDRLPQARVAGIDADPLLLGLARAAYADRGRLRLVEYDLRDRGWVAALDLDRAPDAFVSTTALHWLTTTELATLYATCAGLLAPGGVLVDGDNLAGGPDRPRLDAVTREVGRRRAVRAGAPTDEDWAAWWRAAYAAPELAELAARRGERSVDHHVDAEPTLDDHLAALRDAGFAEAGVVWQHGDDRVVVGLR